MASARDRAVYPHRSSPRACRSTKEMHDIFDHNVWPWAVDTFEAGYILAREGEIICRSTSVGPAGRQRIYYYRSGCFYISGGFVRVSLE